jgi:hypothetical protein
VSADAVGDLPPRERPANGDGGALRLERLVTALAAGPAWASGLSEAARSHALRVHGKGRCLTDSSVSGTLAGR